MLEFRKLVCFDGAVMALAVIALTACGWGAPRAFADVWQSVEPYDSTTPGLDYYDGSPNGYCHPCEIFGMTLWDAADNTFGFEIQTNFGDLAERQAFDAAHSNWRWIDSYTTSSPYLRMQNFAVGDLYIRVCDSVGASDQLYGLVLESRTGTDADLWHAALERAGYPSYAAKGQGELYQWVEGQEGFATGTYEEYAGNFDEMPDMALARELPGLADTSAARLRNAYPSLLLDGSLVDTDGNWARWRNTEAVLGTDYVGVWEGEFVLPDYIPETQYLEVWWSMACGNDGVRVLGFRSGAEPVPAPPSVLLLLIGSVCSAAYVRLRRER